MFRFRSSSIRTRLLVVAGAMALIAIVTGAIVTAGGSGGSNDVRILARHTDDGRTEVALQQRDADHSWGETVFPRQRFLAADTEPGRWRASSAIQLDDSYAVEPAAVGLTATATLSSPDGESMGEVTFTQGPRGVLIQARVSGLDAGAHGFHIHQTGSCEPDFGAAGGHFNPTGLGHGPLHEGGHHAGDLPNLIAHDDGAGLADYYTEDVTLASGIAHSLFDADGSAIVIHVDPDSYGEDAMAGGRVACGVITLD